MEVSELYDKIVNLFENYGNGNPIQTEALKVTIIDLIAKTKINWCKEERIRIARSLDYKEGTIGYLNIIER